MKKGRGAAKGDRSRTAASAAAQVEIDATEEDREVEPEPQVKQEKTAHSATKKPKATARVKGAAQWSEEENLVRASPCVSPSPPVLRLTRPPASPFVRVSVLAGSGVLRYPTSLTSSSASMANDVPTTS